jgi:hypothetical protein
MAAVSAASFLISAVARPSLAAKISILQNRIKGDRIVN